VTSENLLDENRALAEIWGDEITPTTATTTFGVPIETVSRRSARASPPVARDGSRDDDNACTQVTPQLIRFANGLAVYKARLSVGNSVAVWDYREPAVGERQQLARTPISESVTDSAEGEPGHEEPCAARRGRVQEKDGVFLHFCVECGRFGPFGYGVRLRAGQLGRWYCREHRPQGHEP